MFLVHYPVLLRLTKHFVNWTNWTALSCRHKVVPTDPGVEMDESFSAVKCGKPEEINRTFGGKKTPTKLI